MSTSFHLAAIVKQISQYGRLASEPQDPQF